MYTIEIKPGTKTTFIDDIDEMFNVIKENTNCKREEAKEHVFNFLDGKSIKIDFLSEEKAKDLAYKLNAKGLICYVNGNKINSEILKNFIERYNPFNDHDKENKNIHSMKNNNHSIAINDGTALFNIEGFEKITKSSDDGTKLTIYYFDDNRQTKTIHFESQAKRDQEFDRIFNLLS